MLFTFVMTLADTINTQVHETMRTTPYELVFGQPPRTVIAPDATIGGVMDEAVIKQEESSSDDDQDRFDDHMPGSNLAGEEEGGSNGRNCEVVEDEENVSEIALVMVE